MTPTPYDLTPVLRQRDDGDTRTVSVCMDCLPGESLFGFFPWLAGNVQLSHGICRAHADQRRAEIEALKVTI